MDGGSGGAGGGSGGGALVYILAAVVAAAIGGPLVIVGLRRRPSPTTPAIPTSSSTADRAVVRAEVPAPEPAPVVSLPGPGPRSRRQGAVSASVSPPTPGVVTPLPAAAPGGAFADPLLDALAARGRSDAGWGGRGVTTVLPGAAPDERGTPGPAWVRRLDAKMKIMPHGLPERPADHDEGRGDRTA